MDRTMNIAQTIETTVDVNNQKSKYIVGRGILNNLTEIEEIQSAEEFLLLVDETVFPLFGVKVEEELKKTGKTVVVSVIPSGESEKNIENLPKLIKTFISSHISRKTILVAVGGGVTTDIGGFIASILYRGIPSIYIPTTLLSQVDASIGGKSGMNITIGKSTYKNMVGTITQPICVLSDIDVLDTLPEKELVSALGEIVKYTIGWGKPDVEVLNKVKARDPKALEEVVCLSQKLKLDVIQKDPNDTKHIRESLNFGHTIGHAVEGTSDGRLSHGEAVSVGLVASLHISMSLGYIKQKDYEKFVDLLRSLGLPIKVKGIEVSRIKAAMMFDKKGGTFVLLEGNKLKTNVSVSETIVDKALQEIV